jgi:Flp pilus assembly protein TadG
MCGATSPATRSSLRRRLVSDESGQILLMTGVLMVIMLVLVALVVDIGHTRLVQRQLQAGVDAAALAAAQELPEDAPALATADEYSPSPGAKNALNTVNNATTTAVTRCIPSIPGCNTRFAKSNAVTVTSTSNVPTFFARIIGISSLTVTAKATACFPCSIRPLDIILILDRTGSMCDSGSGSCSTGRDLDGAKEGIKTFLSMMDPKLDRVGLAVLPPAVGPSLYSTQDAHPCLRWRSGRPHTDANCIEWTQVQVRNADSPQNVCGTPTSSNHYYGYNAYAPYWEAETDASYRNGDRSFYVVSSLSDDDVDNDSSDDYVQETSPGVWDLNNSSPIVSTLNCIKAAGSTSYSLAIDEAAHELEIHGRPDVQDVIVFFTDGGANTVPNTQAAGWPSSGAPWTSRPCGSGVEAAKRVPSDTAVYTIGYNLENQTAANQRCQQPGSSGQQDNSRPAEVSQTWGQTPQEALLAMASTPENFYYTADVDKLKKLFQRIAGDILSNASRLVDNDLPDLIE